eukprot:scaffold404640_cov37-Prasinocladus_malaysianus.AAC.1
MYHYLHHNFENFGYEHEYDNPRLAARRTVLVLFVLSRRRFGSTQQCVLHRTRTYPWVPRTTALKFIRQG